VSGLRIKKEAMPLRMTRKMIYLDRVRKTKKISIKRRFIFRKI